MGKRETWKFIIQTVMAILSAIATSFGVASCCYKVLRLLSLEPNQPNNQITKQHYLVMRISRGYRNNNPLNIRRCAKNRWVGLAEVQGDGEFCVFRSMVYGVRAAFVLLRTYGRWYGCNVSTVLLLRINVKIRSLS